MTATTLRDRLPYFLKGEKVEVESVLNRAVVRVISKNGNCLINRWWLKFDDE